MRRVAQSAASCASAARPATAARLLHPSALLGRAIRFLYPAANYRGVRLRYDERLLRVDAIRDCEEAELEPETRAMDPRLRRSRWLLTGEDLKIGEERSFYFGSMREVEVVEVVPEREEFCRVIGRRGDKPEVVLAECLPISQARVFATVVERDSDLHGLHAQSHEVRLPVLIRNADGKLQ